MVLYKHHIRNRSFSLETDDIGKKKIWVITLFIDFEMGVHICDNFINYSYVF